MIYINSYSGLNSKIKIKFILEVLLSIKLFTCTLEMQPVNNRSRDTRGRISINYTRFVLQGCETNRPGHVGVERRRGKRIALDGWAGKQFALADSANGVRFKQTH